MGWDMVLMLTGAFLAHVGQVIVAWHIIPLPVLSADHHHTVLAASKEVVRLVLSPVLKNL